MLKSHKWSVSLLEAKYTTSGSILGTNSTFKRMEASAEEQQDRGGEMAAPHCSCSHFFLYLSLSPTAAESTEDSAVWQQNPQHAYYGVALSVELSSQ